MQSRFVFVLLLQAFATLAQAQVPVTDDAFTSSATPNANYGVGLALVVQSPTAAGAMPSPAELGGFTANTYLKFDLSALPPNITAANLSKANLRLYVDFVVSPGTFDVYQAAGSWNEGTLTASNAPGIVGSPINQSPISVTKALKYIDIDITSAFANGAPANGLVLVPSKGSPIFASFDSKENPLTSHDPELSVSVNDASNAQLQQEIQRATQAENTISTNLATEITRAEGAESAIKQNLSTEVSRAETAEGMLQGNINTVQNDLSNYAQLAKQNTFLTSQTIAGDLSLDGNLNLQGSTGFNSAVINMNGTPFIHAYGPYGVFNGNTSVGSGAGNLSTTGVNDTAVGYQALSSDSSGTFNTAVGTYALSSDTTGSDNTAVGRAALGANTTGFENLSIGLHSLYRNTSGSSNTAAGNYALFFNTTGTGNTAVGWQAGSTGFAGNTSGSNNTFIGYFAGSGGFTDLSNSTAVGANAEVFESNALVLGGTGGNAVNVGIGTSTPHSPLDVVGNANVAGNLNITGTLTGNGSGLNHVTADSAKIADNANTAGFATNAGTASNATTANTAGVATNALALGGVPASGFAQQGLSNNFTVSQSINGNLNIAGSGNGIIFSDGTTQTTAAVGQQNLLSRELFSAFLAGPADISYTASTFVPNQPITVTRMTVNWKTPPGFCDANPASVRVTDGVSSQDVPLLGDRPNVTRDSGPFIMKSAQGSLMSIQMRSPVRVCAHPAADINVQVEYKAQDPAEPNSCGFDTTNCSNSCVFLGGGDPENCGACGHACGGNGGVCAFSKCVVCGPDPVTGNAPTVCNGSCTDTSADNNNCGSCGQVCPGGPGGLVCTNGQCLTPSGGQCNTGSQCASGVCQQDGTCQ